MAEVLDTVARDARSDVVVAVSRGGRCRGDEAPVPGESGGGDERFAEAFRSHYSTGCPAALDCLAGIAQAEPESATEVSLIAQDDDGNTVGETVYASSVSVPA